MRARTSTLLIVVYAVIALVVVLLFAVTNNQHRKTKELLAALEESTRDAERRQLTSNQKQPRRSLRPALFKLERLLEERTRVAREQQSQLRKQISGREQLQQKYEELSEAYEQLLNDHQVLASEVEFYINAAMVAAEEAAELDGTQDVGEVPAEVSAETEFGELVPNEQVLQQQMAALDQAAQRDAIIANYASHAMVEMGASAVPLVASVLGDESADVRLWAAWVLGEIGADAAVAAPELQALLSDNNEEVAAAAASALEKIVSP